jgi:MYXO-CTERM domain-containing protein
MKLFNHTCFAAGSRVLTVLAVVVSAVLGSTQIASAGFQSETYEFQANHANPTWDTTYTGTFDVPKFDTMGGSRTLLGITFEYFSPELDYTYTVHNNPTADTVGAQARWEMTFGLSDSSGTLLLPLEQDPHVLSHARSRGVIVPPFFDEGYTNVVTYDPEIVGADYYEVTDEPSILAAFTGVGVLSLNYEMTLSDVVYSAVTFPPGLPRHVFDPSILDVTPDLYHAGLNVVYHYTSVPAPGALVLLGVAGATARRRRRS